jgi:hypothetical protein
MAVLVVLAAIAALIVLLLWVPVDFRVAAGTEAGVHFHGRWLYGAVRFGTGGRRRARPAAPKEEEKHERGGALRALRTLRRLLAIDGLATGVGRLARDLSRALRWRSARFRLRAGLGDPADTGELCGVVGAIGTFLPARSAFEFLPEFGAAVFDADAEVSGRIWPARVVGALGRFVFSRPGWRVIRVLAWKRGS